MKHLAVMNRRYQAGYIDISNVEEFYLVSFMLLNHRRKLGYKKGNNFIDVLNNVCWGISDVIINSIRYIDADRGRYFIVD